jgi:hypothetical protein
MHIPARKRFALHVRRLRAAAAAQGSGGCFSVWKQASAAAVNYRYYTIGGLLIGRKNVTGLGKQRFGVAVLDNGPRQGFRHILPP